MIRSCVFAAALVALAAPVWAQAAAPAADPGQNLEERLDSAVGSDAIPVPAFPAEGELRPGDFSLNSPEPRMVEPDASLAEPISPRRLPTPVDHVNVDQRIDKGLTAAGEETAFPPDFAYGAFQRGYFLTAFSLALQRAEAGDPVAQTLLGELLSRGLGVQQDLKAAFDWYSLAGAKGDPEALYSLGRFYLEGVGLEQDFAKAADHLERAAKLGHAVAAREFSYLLLQGQGREKNAMLAAAYLRRAAGLGDMDAQYALAGLYTEGVGVVADEAQAARWYGESARNGHIGAEIEYAIMLFNGRGVPKDEATAARWFREAADADNPLAQVRLARLLVDGRGVDADPAEAARWYLIAKSRGLQDDFLEDWLTRLDQATREAGQQAAERWTSSRPGWVQAAAAPAEESAPVDNEVE
jgi:TPR repeat protein